MIRQWSFLREKNELLDALCLIWQLDKKDRW